MPREEWWVLAETFKKVNPSNSTGNLAGGTCPTDVGAGPHPLYFYSIVLGAEHTTSELVFANWADTGPLTGVGGAKWIHKHVVTVL